MPLLVDIFQKGAFLASQTLQIRIYANTARNEAFLNEFLVSLFKHSIESQCTVTNDLSEQVLHSTRTANDI